MMVEQIPLPLVFHQRMVIGPASRRRLLHYQAFKLERPHRTVAHGIGQSLCLVLHPRKSQIIFAVTFKGERPLLEPFRQTDYRNRLRVKLYQIILQLGHIKSAARPVQICLPVFVKQYARVDAEHAFYRFCQRRKRAVWLVRRCDSYIKAFATLRTCREIEIIFPVLIYTVGGPHGIRFRISPGNIFLRKDYAMIFPVNQIFGRENMIVGHTKPLLQPLYRTRNIV